MSIDQPESNAPSRRRTLRELLDLLVAISALVTSAVSVWLAVSQGDDMERLVQAQSWPYIGFHSGNSTLDEASKQRVRSLSFTLENLGVGPARVRSFEVFIDNVPVRDHSELMRRARGLKDSEVLPQQYTFTISAHGRVLRAGEAVNFLRYDFEGADAPTWEALDKARFGRLMMRVCYCSVFDECWINQSDAADPIAVAACPVVTSYRE